MDITIYHNRRCSKSRQALALLQERGLEPRIIEYLETPPDKKTIQQLLSMLGKTPRELIRENETEYKEAGLDNPTVTDEALISAMIKYPKLIQRPIVVADGQARIGRPPESVLEIIEPIP